MLRTGRFMLVLRQSMQRCYLCGHSMVPRTNAMCNFGEVRALSNYAKHTPMRNITAGLYEVPSLGWYPTSRGMLKHFGPGSIILSRCFAKMKKAKSKKKQSSKVLLATDLAEGVVDLKDISDKMDDVCTRLKDTLTKKVTTRINSGMLDDVMVETGSGRKKLFHIASIKSDAKAFTITILDNFTDSVEDWVPVVYDAVGFQSGNLYFHKAEKKIQESIKNAGYDFSFQVNEGSIRIQIPLLTKDYREQLKRMAKSLTEQSKVRIRKIRQQGMVELRKNQDMVSKDDAYALEKQIQQLHDGSIGKIEDALEDKCKELDKS